MRRKLTYTHQRGNSTDWYKASILNACGTTFVPFVYVMTSALMCMNVRGKGREGKGEGEFCNGTMNTWTAVM